LQEGAEETARDINEMDDTGRAIAVVADVSIEDQVTHPAASTIAATFR
jgi:hypothetical protein